LNERGRHVGQGSENIVAVSWISSFVCRKPPVKVEEEVRATHNLSLGHLLDSVRQKGGYGFGNGCRAWVPFWQREDQP